MPDVLIEDLTCGTCGKVAKTKAGRAAHVRGAHPAPVDTTSVSVPDVPVEALNPSGALAIIEDWNQAQRVASGHRSVTLSDPRCKICQGRANAPRTWYRTCPHDPYVTKAPVRMPSTFEPVLDADGKDTGYVKEVQGNLIAFKAIPNTREVGLTLAQNSGQGMRMAQSKGWIALSAIRSPLFPNGVAECCQFLDCRWQEGRVDPLTGQVTHLKLFYINKAAALFCRVEEAQICGLRETGKTVWVGGEDEDNKQLRRDQLAGSLVGPPVD